MEGEITALGAELRALEERGGAAARRLRDGAAARRLRDGAAARRLRDGTPK